MHTEGSVSIVQCWIVLNVLFFTNKAYAVISEKNFFKFSAKLSAQSEFFNVATSLLTQQIVFSYTGKEKLCGVPPKGVLK
jgi:hypothetical protein